MIENTTSTNMGIGDLGKPETIFSRKFRWTLAGEHLPDTFIKCVSFDYVNRTIKFAYYDVTTGKDSMHALVWADMLAKRQLFNETLTFTALDGCGKSLYTLTFKNLSLVSHGADFDYSSNDVATTVITVKYSHMSKDITGQPDVYSWKLVHNNVEIPMFWAEGQRPSLCVSETEIPHLNSKFLIPGQAKWLDSKIVTSADSKELFSCFMSGQKFPLEIRLYNNNVHVESWHMENTWIKTIDGSEAETALSLSYSSVRYEAIPKKAPESRGIKLTASSGHTIEMNDEL